MRSPRSEFSAAEYLAMEEVAEYRSEFCRGQILPMTSGPVEHGTVIVNCMSELREKVDARPCYVYATNLRLHVPRSDFYTYPDVMVICGKVQFLDRRNDTVTNPLLLIEVLSESTRDYDRGTKFGFYKQIPTLREYVLIESEQAHIECYRRGDDDRWTMDSYDGLDASVQFESLDCKVPLRRIYHKVSWLD